MRLALVALMLAACADHKPVTATTGSAVGSASAAPQGSGANMNESITATVVGQKPGRPPITRLLVDVQLKNDNAAARWFVIPSKLPAGDGGIDKLEQLTAPPGVVVGRFLGTGGRYAVRLAPGARVSLRKLEVAWWRSGDPPLAFEVAMAGEVKLGDETMASWFDKDPTISGAVDVDMEAAQHTASHRAKDDVEVKATLTDSTALPLQLTP